MEEAIAYNIHEGKTLKVLAKLSKGGISALIECLPEARQTVYNRFDAQTLDNDFKRRALDCLGADERQFMDAAVGSNGLPLPRQSGTQSNARDLGAVVSEYTNKGGRTFRELESGKLEFDAPVVAIKARAGYRAGWGNPIYIERLPTKKALVDHAAKGEYKWFEAEGDSMNDGTVKAICEGDYALSRLLTSDKWDKAKLHTHRYRYWVIHTIDGLLIKEIIAHDVNARTITIHSLNPDKEKYPDEVISLDIVSELYNIVKIEREL